MTSKGITYLTDAFLIECLVERDKTEKVVNAAVEMGAQGAIVNYAEGKGVKERMGLLGVTIDNEKSIIRIIVSEEQSDQIFKAMSEAAEINEPGKGIMWITSLDKIATHIPEDILKRVDNE